MNVPIYQQALGKDFHRLQPELQEYFSLAPGSGHYGVGEGVFDVVGCRQGWLRPLLKLTSGEEVFFPEYGESIPFRIENHSHLDPFGRSSLTARREIRFPGRSRIFQDTTSLVESDGGPRLVDYLGRFRRMLTDLKLSVTDNGRLRGVSEESRLFLGPPPAAASHRGCQGLRRAVVGRIGRRAWHAPHPSQSYPAADRAGAGLCRKHGLPAAPVYRWQLLAELPAPLRPAGALGKPYVALNHERAGSTRRPPA